MERKPLPKPEIPEWGPPKKTLTRGWIYVVAPEFPKWAVWSVVYSFLIFPTVSHFCFALPSLFGLVQFVLGAAIIATLADLISGIVHIYLDLSVIRNDDTVTDFMRFGFQEHHADAAIYYKRHPGFKPHYEMNSIYPITSFAITCVRLIFGATHIVTGWVIVLASFSLLHQCCHYWSHARTGGKPVPQWVRKGQDMGILLPPRIHKRHHATYDVDFCILNGAMNPVLNYVYTHYGDFVHTKFVPFLDFLNGSSYCPPPKADKTE